MPENKETGVAIVFWFFFSLIFFFFFWQVLFGSLKGTGTPILGKQGSKTGNQVPETGT